MRSLNHVIVEFEEQYKNTKKIGGLDLIVNLDVDDVSFINRVATIVSLPSGTILKKGDLVIVHHNIARKRFTPKGEALKSNYFIEDNKFFVPPNLVFMYYRDGVWNALAPFTFIRPIKHKSKYKGSLFIPESAIEKEYTYKGNRMNLGEVAYINQPMTDMGLKQGDNIVFKRDAEYEFEIGGEILYKMSTNDVIAKIEGEV